MSVKQKREHKLLVLLLSASLCMSFVINTLAYFIPQAVAAKPSTSAVWVDQATLNYQNRIFKENNAGDNDWHFTEVSPADGCADVIENFVNPGYNSAHGPYKSQTVRLDEQTRLPGGGCTPGAQIDIGLPTVPSGWQTAFVWQDDSNIKSADGTITFAKQSDGTFVNQNDSGDCKDYITVGPNKSNLTLVIRAGKLEMVQGKYEDDGKGDSGWPFAKQIQLQSNQPQKINSSECYISKPIFPVQADATKSGIPGIPQTGNKTTPDDSCESQNTALSWILCPVIRLLDGAVSSLDTNINSQLQTRDFSDPSNPSNANIKEAWGRIRNVALIVLIPIMLVMVIGTAVGFAAIDAYTVKRAMPRLLIAVLFISLSWYITVFAVNFTNVVARGIFGLITQPFGLANKSLVDFIKVGTGVKATGFLILGGLIALARVDMAIIFSVIGVAALALFAAFLVLVIRQILIIALILVAPLAVLSWIFPSNNDIWKAWYGTFSKLLIMYPLIMLLIGAGRIGAFIIPNQQGSNSFFTQLLVIITYILPYFLIPATFKFAGGIFANLAGIVNDRSRGFFDRQRKFREERRQALKQRAGVGKRFNPANPFIKRMSESNNKWVRRISPNRLGEFSAAPILSAAYYSKDRNIPFLSTRGRRLSAEIKGKEMEESRKYAQTVNERFGYNDKASAAVGGMYDSLSNETQIRLYEQGMTDNTAADEIRDENGRLIGIRGIKAKGSLKTEADHLKMASILDQSSSDSEKKAGVALREAAAWTEAQYANPEMNHFDTAIGAAMHRASHGFFDGRDAEAVGRIIRKEHHGDTGLANAAVGQAEFIGREGHPENKPGYGHWIDEDGNIRDGLDPRSDRGFAVASTLDASAFARAKGDVLKDDRFGGVVKDILMVDQSPEMREQITKKWLDAGVSYEDIARRLTMARNARRGIQQAMFASAGPYSNASADVQQQARRIIKEAGLEKEFADYTRGLDAEGTLGRPGAGGGGGGIGPTEIPSGFDMGGGGTVT